MEPAFKIQISRRKDKKYDVIFADNRPMVSFGGIRRNGIPYEHYKDRTALKAFKSYDHGDKDRRARYYNRHGSMVIFHIINI